ncbi:aminotransferase class V-fold PLP-dependent enzyme [Aurantibacillus circumpalustris]|uniref:aminotransferase class V-fold PLP-dependent enzyme n=1 Tax=Aurantibacillus circumpalustris TaxID=3036359 RepID=UPI00295B5553|nr:aminotransferase class V-fold PLP-dependent enzyme [Aurantibacillus circumpalustris]
MSILKDKFLLNPEITYLNFGSFGACPKVIFEDYQKWQRELEVEPAQFITVNSPVYLKGAREALANYIHCAADDLVYVTNPSYAINIIAKSLKLNSGDEILSTDLEYGALDRTWNYYTKQAKAKYVRQKIHLPLVSKEKLIEDFFAGLSSKTKAIFISHITSSTALILPVKEICAIAKQKGLLTIVDGAHVPGHIDLNLSELEADIYTGACHKWMLTAKGCSFLYVKKELQELFDPLVVSWGYEADSPSSSQFLDYHQMQGTRDISAFLTVPRAIAFLKENDWKTVASDSRALVQKNAQFFCDLVGAQPLCPITDEFLGQMFSIPINPLSAERLQRYLFQTYNIEIPVMVHGESTYLRYSINAFNTQKDLDHLSIALKEIIEVTDFIAVPERLNK